MGGPSEGRLSLQRGEGDCRHSVEREIAGTSWRGRLPALRGRGPAAFTAVSSALVANDHDQRFLVPLQPLSRSAAPDTRSFWSGSHGGDATVKAAERVSLFNSFNAELSPKR